MSLEDLRLGHREVKGGKKREKEAGMGKGSGEGRGRN